jgi:hypothetical protein
MNEEQGFSTFLKVIIIALILVLVVIVVLIYSKSLEKELVNEVEEKVVQIEEKVIDIDQQVKDYQSSLLGVISSFDNDYQSLQEDILEISVPNGFQELHLKLVLALNPIIHESSSELTKEKLEDIGDVYDWLKEDLANIILNIK